MIDKRIEAALEAAWSHTTQYAGGMSFSQYEDKNPDAAGEFRKAIVAALAAADAAAWRPISECPPSEPVLIMSQHGAAVAQWDVKIDGWRNEDTMYSPRYFTRWQTIRSPLEGEVQRNRIAELEGGKDG